jgi:hypothetical protein
VHDVKVIVTEDAVREFLREAIGGAPHAGRFDNSPVEVNAVVDPSAASTAPDNTNFKPRNKREFKVALSTIVDDIEDDDAPEAYDAVVDAIDNLNDKDKDKKMKDEDSKVEETIRLSVRKMLDEAWTTGPSGAEIWTDETPKKPRKGKPAPGPVVGDMPPVKKLPPEEHGGEFNRGVEKYKKDLRKSLKTWDDSSIEDAPVADAPAPGRGRKNKMMTDIGGTSFKDMAAELGFASESGAKQAVERIMQKAAFASSMDEDDLQILTLTAVKDYISKLRSADAITDADAQLMKDHPTIVADLDSFRVFLGSYIKKAQKAAQKSEARDPYKTYRREPRSGETTTSAVEDQDIADVADREEQEALDDELDDDGEEIPYTEPEKDFRSRRNPLHIEGKKNIKKESSRKLNEIGKPLQPSKMSAYTRQSWALPSEQQDDNDYPEEMDFASPDYGEECPNCGSTNTTYSEPIPSMMGYGEEQSLTCNDCNQEFCEDPLRGGWGSGRSVKRESVEQKGQKKTFKAVVEGSKEKQCDKCGRKLTLDNTKYQREEQDLGPDEYPQFCDTDSKEGYFGGMWNEARRIVKAKHTAKCKECGKSMTQQDKDEYEAEGGTGWPRICTWCAESEIVDNL